MKCVFINVIYIKSSILLFLIQLFAKEFYQTYVWLSIVCTPQINIRKALRVVHDLGLLYEQTIKFRIVYNTNNNKAKTLKPLRQTRWTANIMY